MVKIVNEKLINPFSGEPFQAQYNVKRDGKLVPLIDERTGKQFRDPFGNVVFETETHDLTTAMAISAMLEHGFPTQNADKESQLKPPAMTDANQCMKVLDALRPFKLLEIALLGRQPEYIVFDQDTYDWLVTAFNNRSLALWGKMAPCYIKAIANTASAKKLESKKKSGTASGNGADEVPSPKEAEYAAA